MALVGAFGASAADGKLSTHRKVVTISKEPAAPLTAYPSEPVAIENLLQEYAAQHDAGAPLDLAAAAARICRSAAMPRPLCLQLVSRMNEFIEQADLAIQPPPADFSAK